MIDLIQTERLTLRLASDEEMRELITEEKNADLKKAYSEMLEQCAAYPEQRQWYAAWFIALPTGEKIGELCFKGLSSDGTVEIGYGLHPAYWGNGYAAEAVTAVTEWASKQAGVNRIEAETDAQNMASQRVLLKAGFLPTGRIGEEGPRFLLLP